ncbi:hypothetical protein BABINDRAFT_163561 [Babjeviella inositovora NRRL Y-12698]|uniref:Uncharacterized protein n=1 Tax=Babjeviella inositovora NRRL Y-12698 TaxID=984486 RepID=A0A1E3QHU5_9ASCO|nr:uncharacterized protein BABINDRAFT_163561 [Babjeviella inositovora NRRL Y-12698]ODQ77283.1 hypothetical protein BABINDRAFT_163561 [Babjeviella inositovora NRRL Y-12698]
MFSLTSFLSCLFAFTFLHTAIADISLSNPVPGSSFSGSTGTVSISVEWIDSGGAPPVSEIESYTFSLMTGSNLDISNIATLADAVSALKITDDTYTVTFKNTVCGNGLFYIQVYGALLASAGSTIQYTNRFTLTGMTGSKVASGSGSPPQGQISLVTGGTAAASINPASFSVPYTLQTGSTRYAPMQLQPGTSITVTTWSRRFPTSAVTYFTTKMASPVVYSTVTPGWSYTINSQPNYASPAPNPSIAGWYAASERLVSASLSGSSNTTAKAKRYNKWVDEA